MRLWGFDGFCGGAARDEASPSWLSQQGDAGALRIGSDGVEEQNSGADTIGGNFGTTGTISIGGAQNGFVNTVGDDDWYRIDLVAGQSYVFSLTGGTLADPYLELYNEFGGLVAFDDDFGDGTNALLRFTPVTSATYFVNARAFEGQGVSNTGSYTLTANTGAPASPLDSINYHFTMPGPNIAIWFAPAGFSNPSGDAATRDWNQTEINAVFAALATYSAVIPLTFTQAASQATANWILSLAELEGNTLGYFNPGVNGYGAFDPTVGDWTTGLSPGGGAFVTLIHEFGHGLGLAHPHDNGSENYGPDNSEVMQGVIQEFNSFGTFQMNQGVFTTMTYNDGWQTAPFGPNTSGTVGGQATPMALDIALLQQNYGANPNTNAGATSYNLLSIASAYRAIWDVSGTDSISFDGSSAATIDLRAATLLNAVGGGGYVSYVSGIHGGFTIANGVVIENAVGGSGNDTLIGNAAANTLDGGQGADQMTGGLGDDRYIIDNAGDVANENPGEGVDEIVSSIDHTLGADFERLTLTGGATNGTGNAADNIIIGNAGNNVLTGLGGGDILDGGAGADQMIGGAGNDRYYVDSLGDTITELADEGIDEIVVAGDWTLGANIEWLTLAAGVFGTGNAVDNVITGNANGNVLSGLAGSDRLIGMDGGDVLDGGTGGDEMIGGAGD
ncbi:MAG: M10 family metallopeptidase C-terminal domain-containing protein, partial [Hyphomonadaceae bacterium]